MKQLIVKAVIYALAFILSLSLCAYAFNYNAYLGMSSYLLIVGVILFIYLKSNNNESF